jgi:BolA protein
MKPTHDALFERFRQAFPEASIQVEDESHLHVGHVGAAGGAGYFRVRVIDARFNELQRIARHRLVYAAVSDWMPELVHALNIIAMTLEEAGTLIDHAAESFQTRDITDVNFRATS